MALPMTLIIIAGEIDLSVESMAGLSCALLGFLFASGVPLEVGIPIVLVIGAIGGLLNGAPRDRAGLPSLVVTLGHARAVPRAGARRPRAAGHQRLPGLVHRLRLRDRARARRSRGRSSSSSAWPSSSASSSTARGSGASSTPSARTPRPRGSPGVRVARLKLLLFVLSGTVAALAGVILTARFASARADIGQGMTLTVVTIVLLGGVNIFGGRGTIPGSCSPR